MNATLKCGSDQPASPPYAELHCLSNFSFLQAASHPDELVAQAAALGYSALAITDRHSVAGVVRAHVAAKEHRLKLIIGAEIHPLDGPPLILWAINRVGYGRLVRLLTLGKRRAPKGQCELSVADVCDHAEGLLAGVIECGMRSADRGAKATSSSLPTPHSELRTSLAIPQLRSAFPTRLYLLAHLHRGPDDRRRLAEQLALAEQLNCRSWPRAMSVITNPAGERCSICSPRSGWVAPWPSVASNCSSTPSATCVRARNLSSIMPRLPSCSLVPSRLPSAARSRSTNCVTSIPRNSVRTTRLRSNISRGSLGPGRMSGIRAAFPTRCGER